MFQRSRIYSVSDSQWLQINPLLPIECEHALRAFHRRVLLGIGHTLQCGTRWGDSAVVYGSKKTRDNCVVHLAESGISADTFGRWQNLK